MEILIRRADEGDIDLITELENEIFTESRNREDIEKAIGDDNKNIWCACADGELVGYAWVEYTELIAIAVNKKFRNLGIGGKLLHRAVLNADELFLEVRKSNEDAIRLYSSGGFEFISVRKRYYPDGEDAVVMRYKK